jgi:hypothetical protein
MGFSERLWCSGVIYREFIPAVLATENFGHFWRPCYVCGPKLFAVAGQVAAGEQADAYYFRIGYGSESSWF